MDTPSRVSKRLSQKRKLEGPDATSPLVRLKKKYDSEFPTIVKKSIKREPGVKSFPLREKKAEKSTKKPLKLKQPCLQLVDIMTQIPPPNLEIMSVEKEVLEELERQVEPLIREIDPAESVQEEEMEDLEEGQLPREEEEILRKAFEKGARDDGGDVAEQIFRVVGAVVGADLVREMTLDNDDWILGTERECNVRAQIQDQLLLFGTVQEITDAQHHLGQHLSSVREERQRREEEEERARVAAEEEAAAAEEAAAFEAEKLREEKVEEEESKKKVRGRKPGRKKRVETAQHACKKCKGLFVSEEALCKHEAYHIKTEDSEAFLPDVSQFYVAVNGTTSEQNIDSAKCFKCDWSGKLTDYVKHVNTCKFKRLTCSICSCAFPTDYTFKKHFATHFDEHGNLLEITAAKEKEDRASKEEEEGAGVDPVANVAKEEGDALVEGVPEGEGTPAVEGTDVAAVDVINALIELQASAAPEEAETITAAVEKLAQEVPDEQRQLVTSATSGTLMYTCTLCCQVLPNEREFSLHYGTHFDVKGALNLSAVTKEISSDHQENLEDLWSEYPSQVPDEVMQQAVTQVPADVAFKCKFCAFVAETESQMKTHVTSHFEKLKKKKSELKCPICSRQMQTEASLNRHIAIAHENNQPELIEMFDKYICEVDPDDPESWDALLVHDYVDPKLLLEREIGKEDTTTGEVEDSCPDCGYKGSRHAIYKHRQRHHTKTLHKCTMCTKSFAIASDLANHMRIHKKNAEKDTGTKKEPVRNYMCRLCGYRGIVYAVRVHMQRKHKPGGHPCSDCSCCFATKSELNRHAKSHLTPEEVQQRVEKRRRVPTSRVWACHICPYTTPHSETDLKEHISRKHEAPKLKCEYCGKMFAVSYDLKDHINHMHLKLKRVVCDICGLEVHRKNLKAHVQRVHEKLRPYRCDICNRSFGDRRFLLRHKTHHLPKEKRATTVFCKVCNKVYVSQKSLDDHMNVHRGIKPYACDQCDAQFSKRIMWQRHMRNHVRGLIKCPVTDCNRQMESDMLLNKHMVKKHRETAQFQCSQCLQFFSLRSVVDKHRCHPPPTGVIAFADETGEGAIQMLQEADSISEPSYIIKEEQLVVPDQSVILTESGTLESLQAMEAPPPQEGGEEAKVFMCSICQAMFTSMEEIEAHIVTHMDGTEEQSNNQVVQVENIVQDGVVQVAQDSVVQEGLLVEGEDGVYTIAYSEELQEVHESAEALTDLTFIQQ